MPNQLSLFQELEIKRSKERYNHFYRGVKERADKRRREFLNSNDEQISILIQTDK